MRRRTMRRLYVLAFLLTALGVSLAAAQTGGGEIPDPTQPTSWLAAILAVSGPLLLMVGRFLNELPAMRKYIPWINFGLSLLAKLGVFRVLDPSVDVPIPTGGEIGSTSSMLLLAGISFTDVLSFVWAGAETFVNQTIYENAKAKARVRRAMNLSVPIMSRLLVPEEKQRPPRKPATRRPVAKASPKKRRR